MYSSLPQSPQGLADLIGLAFRIVRRNLGGIFRFILLPSLLAFAVAVLFQWLLTYGMSTVADSKSLAGAVWLAVAILVAFCLLSLCWWFLGMRLLALVRVMLGFAPDLGEASKYMSRRKWSLAGLNVVAGLLFIPIVVAWSVIMFVVSVLLTLVFSVGGPIGGAVGFTIGFALSMVLFLVLGGYYVFANCVFSCQDQPVATILGSAGQLMFANFGRFSLFALLFALVYAVISYPLALPVVIATVIDTVQHGLATGGEGVASGYKPPLYLLVATQAWETGIGFILRPLLMLAFGLLYYDLRVRSEGLDIKRRLDLLISAKAEQSSLRPLEGN